MILVRDPQCHWADIGNRPIIHAPRAQSPLRASRGHKARALVGAFTLLRSEYHCGEKVRVQEPLASAQGQVRHRTPAQPRSGHRPACGPPTIRCTFGVCCVRPTNHPLHVWGVLLGVARVSWVSWPHRASPFARLVLQHCRAVL